jgi:actin-related protein 6
VRVVYTVLLSYREADLKDTGLDDAPLHQVIESSIQACDEELQGLFWANIVLVGGGAKMAGLKNRM